MRAVVFTSTRADYGILRPLLSSLAGADSIKPSLLVTGTHLSPNHGMTVSEIEDDGFEIADRVTIPVRSGDWTLTAISMSAAFGKYADSLARLRPDLVIILGDRFEAFVFAAVCHIARVPIVHLHGGEVTAGSTDDSFRHSITKFASLHLVAADEFHRRVIQLGEDPATVHTVGALGLDTIRAELLSYPIERTRTALITYHPSTIGPEDGPETLRLILDGALGSDLERIVVTRPNIDAGSAAINEVLDSYRSQPRVEVHESLGSRRYLRTMAASSVVIGNSSSGIIEAPFVGTPTINIGRRQDGRPTGRSVIHLPNPSASSIQASIAGSAELIGQPFSSTVYGDGRSADRCMALIGSTTMPPVSKRFQDLRCP